MTKIGFLADTGSDILQFPELYEKMDIEVINLLINIGDETYTDETMPLDELLKKMDTDDKEVWPRTSQPSAGQFVEKYEEMKEQGYTDIISVHVASELSGTVNSARLGAEQVEDLNVYIVDSQMASAGILPTVMKVHEWIEEGLDPKEIQEKANAYAMENYLYAAVPQLDNLYKGGRLKPLKFFLGRLLSFKPILRMAKGSIDSYDKTRNLFNTQTKCYEYAVENFTQDDDFELIISHAWAENIADEFAKRFEREYPGKKYYVGRIGPTMAVHLGPQGIVFVPVRK